MAALAKLLIVALVALSIVYISLFAYARAARRERLEEEWHLSGGEGERDAYVAERLESYLPVLRRRLVVMVYVFPLSIAAVAIYITNAG